MKSTRIEAEENEYPKLKINKERTIIVLFTWNNRGFVVESLNEVYNLGDESRNWAEVDFTTYNGTLTLEN
jgi:hypothetical protein